MASTYEGDNDGMFTNVSNAAVLELEVGSVVYVRLPVNYRIYAMVVQTIRAPSVASCSSPFK